MKQRSEAIESIPGVGVKIAQKLQLIGVHRVDDLRGANPERLYDTLEQTIGASVDRCVLYVFRAAVYFANNQKHDSEKLKWWNWKD
jgi:nucleotidyltransferase/DNA polymerase involved in DNA repair